MVTAVRMTEDVSSLSQHRVGLEVGCLTAHFPVFARYERMSEWSVVACDMVMKDLSVS